MSDLEIGPELVGKSVRCATRPEWGDGIVLQVVSTQHGGGQVQRVRVQFPSGGARWLIIPPARLIAPTAEPSRDKGWLDALGKSTLDDKLRRMPDEVTGVLGSAAERLAAIVPLFALDEEPVSLLRWARDQTGVADPLSHWSRDELLVAFGDFSVERDSYFRNAAALLVRAEGREALSELISKSPAPLREEMRAVLRRII